MGFWSSKSKQPGEAGWRNRKAERYGAATIKCTLGSVLDMSATGIRLNCEKKPPVVVGKVYTTRISFDDGAMPVRVQVRWLKRRGLNRYELGLLFVGVKPGADRVLDAIAKFGMASAAKSSQDSVPTPKKTKQKQSSAGPRVTTDLPDYFAVMGLARDATPKQIKTSYRRLAVTLHPDRSDAPNAIEQFDRLHEAYEVLSDSKRRATYLELSA